MAILISHGTRLAMEMIATALRERGFTVVLASNEGQPHVHAQVRVVLIFAAEARDRVFASIDKCRRAFPEAEIIVVGEDNPDEEIVEFIEAGVRAFTSSGASLDELVTIIKGVMRGESPCSGRLGALVAARIAILAKSQRNQMVGEPLTTREEQILRLVATGLSNKEIGHELSISVHTVKIHVHHILEKLQVRRRREAARWCSRTPRAPGHGPESCTTKELHSEA